MDDKNTSDQRQNPRIAGVSGQSRHRYRRKILADLSFRSPIRIPAPHSAKSRSQDHTFLANTRIAWVSCVSNWRPLPCNNPICTHTTSTPGICVCKGCLNAHGPIDWCTRVNCRRKRRPNASLYSKLRRLATRCSASKLHSLSSRNLNSRSHHLYLTFDMGFRLMIPSGYSSTL